MKYVGRDSTGFLKSNPEHGNEEKGETEFGITLTRVYLVLTFDLPYHGHRPERTKHSKVVSKAAAQNNYPHCLLRVRVAQASRACDVSQIGVTFHGICPPIFIQP